MGKPHFSKLLIFALIIAVSFAYVPQAQAGGVASAVSSVVNTIARTANIIINTVVGVTEIVIGLIPGLGIVGEDGKCRLMNANNTPAKLYYDECGGGGGSSSSGGGGGGGGGPTGPGGGGGDGGGNGNGGGSGPGPQLPIQTITVCSGAFCSGSASCDPNIQSCSDQCGSKYDCGYVDPQVAIQPIQEVVVPDPLRVSWNSSYTSSCSASSNPNVWNGSKSTSGSEDIFNPTSISNRGTYSLSISCSGVFGDGAWAYDSKTARVISLPRCSFSANPSTIVLPEESTLAWNCAYASGGCSIDNGVGSVNSISGSMNVVPSETTTYTLNCNGLDGSRSWQATVTNAFESTIKEVIPR